MSLRSYLVRTYLSIDPRTLGLFRICLGATLLLDLFFRSKVYEHFYSNEGLLPNHTLLWAPPAPRMFSLFFTLSTPTEAAVGMAICGLVFVSLLVGYRTKLSQILAFICLVSLNTRVSPLENGGDMVMNILTTFTMFLPLGKRFSVDSVLASMRRRVEHQPADLADRAAMKLPTPRTVSVIALALILQLGLIYVFNVVHKTGTTWHDGSAVYLTLHQDRIITTFGVWLRDNGPVELFKALTFATIVIETLGACLVLSPFFPVWTRALAIALMPGLHLGFALCINLGPFSYAMALFFTLLVHEKHWEWMYRFMQRHTRRRVVYFDVDCGICFWIARLLARLDLLQRLELRSNLDGLPEGVAAGRERDTLIVQNAHTGRVFERARAVSETIQALPMGFMVAWVLRVPGLNLLFGALYDLVARNRARISAWLGLNACGVPSAHNTAELHEPPPPSGARRLASGSAVVLRELGAWVVVLACAGELLNANSSVPKALRVKQIPELRAVMDYVRLYQGWRMFAPEAPPADVHISVEATTVDGRLVDPYNQVASRVWTVPLKEIPERLENDQYFTTFSLFIPEGRFRPYTTPFEQWILRYHLRTGNPKDRIVKFVAYKLTDESPRLGEKGNRNFRRVEFMRYPNRK